MTDAERSKGKESPIFHDIDDEHKQMRVLLGDVHSILKSRTESVEHVKRAFKGVATYLQQHFDNEDEGGFFAEIVQQAPRLSEPAKQVSQEHARLLADFSELTERAGQGDGTAEWWDKMGTQFHDVSKQLMEHEHREQELLQRAFTEDVGTGD